MDGAKKIAEAFQKILSSLSKKTQSLYSKIHKHFNAFHALHSSLKMDRVDYTFKFSTELAVFVFSLLLIGVNAAGAKNLSFMNSNSFLAKILADHPKANPTLYAQTTSVRTIVQQDGGGIPVISAKVVLAADTSPAPAQPGGNGSIIANNAIINNNPVSARAMIADQIKVYETQQDDTLQSVANKFGISVNTIMWANNLQSQTIKPGWDLIILPVNGVLHKVTANDTLPDIAKKFNADMNSIISYNNLVDDSDIEPGDLLIIPGGSVPVPVKPKPSIANKVGNKIVYEPAPGDIQEVGGQPHSFPWGQCTYYVAQRRNIPWGGNAKNWLENAAAYGAKVGRVPIVGAIMVSNENRRYGHVALVEQVDGDNFLVSEMNYKGRGVVDQRWINLGSSAIKGFIY